MIVPVNIRLLKEEPLHLQDELSASQLDLASGDELIEVVGPVGFDLRVQLVEEGILVRGRLSAGLRCLCARCLQPFDREVLLDEWVCLVPLAGEDAAVVVNDCVDLTPYLREDIFLALPQHPLCSNECQGLLQEYRRQQKLPPDSALGGESKSLWASLDQLNL